MSIASRAEAAVGRLGRRAAFTALAIAAACGAGALFATALFLALDQALGPIYACLVTGAVLAACSGIAVWVGAAMSRADETEEPTNLFAELLPHSMPLAAPILGMIRREPRKALLGAAIAGVVLEMLTSERRRR